jgi:alpha-beta hydrolase superfamily lysophospholipase
VRLDIADAMDVPGPLDINAAVFVPSGGVRPGMPVVCCFPGGNYTWRYYHLEVPGANGYSLADHMADRGCLVVAFDHLGIGESTSVEGRVDLDVDHVLAADRAAADVAVERLRAGTLVPGLAAVERPFLVGAGHSMGGFLLTKHQAAFRTFDAVAVLGWSQLVGGVSRIESPLNWDADDNGLVRLDRKLLHGMFHAADVPDQVKQADDEAGTALYAWARGVQQSGTAQEAAVIEVPVFVGLGESDISPAPLDEPAAYASSSDVTVYVVPGAAHCFNFASARQLFFERLSGWTLSLAAIAGAH